MDTRFGTVAIIGAPNAGKSTLTNALVGGKVSIVSRKVQTTRVKTLGIALYPSLNAQVLILDTPGLFKPQKSLEIHLVEQAKSAVYDADVLMILWDVLDTQWQKLEELIKLLPTNTPKILCYNKIDKNTAFALSPYDHLFDGVFQISALHKKGLKSVMDFVCTHLPKGPWLYPDDILTTQPEALWACEMTREVIYRHYHDELPYETYVEPEGFERFDNGSIKLSQAIVVAKPSQKGIILGKKGMKIKALGIRVREELEKEMGCKIHLKLFVKVEEKWMENDHLKREQGLLS